MKKRQQGFSLIELMIVVAIIGVLSAVAVPAYQNYTTKAKVSSALALATSAKTLISEYRNSNGTWPATNTSIGAGADDGSGLTNEYVEKIVIAAGVITITFKAAGGAVPAALGAKTITWTPAEASGVISWGCASTVVDSLLPGACVGA